MTCLENVVETATQNWVLLQFILFKLAFYWRSTDSSQEHFREDMCMVFVVMW